MDQEKTQIPVEQLNQAENIIRENPELNVMSSTRERVLRYLHEDDDPSMVSQVQAFSELAGQRAVQELRERLSLNPIAQIGRAIEKVSGVVMGGEEDPSIKTDAELLNQRYQEYRSWVNKWREEVNQQIQHSGSSGNQIGVEELLQRPMNILGDLPLFRYHGGEKNGDYRQPADEVRIELLKELGVVDDKGEWQTEIPGSKLVYGATEMWAFKTNIPGVRLNCARDKGGLYMQEVLHFETGAQLKIYQALE